MTSSMPSTQTEQQSREGRSIPLIPPIKPVLGEQDKCQTYRDGLIALCEAQRPEFFLTMRFPENLDISISAAHHKLDLFYAAIDRKLSGRHWHELPPEQLTRLIAIPEGRRISHNSEIFEGLHYHVLLSPPPQPHRPANEDALRALATEKWLKWSGCRDIHVRPIRSVHKAAAYACKKVTDPMSAGRSFVIHPSGVL